MQSNKTATYAQILKERESKLPTDIRKRLDKYAKKNSMTNELIPIKGSRKVIKDGDVFVLQPKKGLYFYGKVIKAANSKSKEVSEILNFVYIYKHRTTKLEMPEYLDPDNLLIPPQIINRLGWSRGYFFNVGNQPVTKEELTIDYGLYSMTNCKWFDVDKNEIDHIPKHAGLFAYGSYGSVAYKLTKEFIKDPTLLELPQQ